METNFSNGVWRGGGRIREMEKPLKCMGAMGYKFANLISKLNFYKLISYPMDNCLSGRRRPACQTPEKDVLCYHWLAGP